VPDCTAYRRIVSDLEASFQDDLAACQGEDPRHVEPCRKAVRDRLQRARDRLERCEQGSLFSVDLTGAWRADDRGAYYIRRLGTAVWWVGWSDPDAFRPGIGFTNVFRGTIDESTGVIDGRWADVPRGGASNAGTLRLQLDMTGDRPALRRIQATGGFGGANWAPGLRPAHPDIRERFDRTRRNDDGSMHDHLKMYKDWTVVFGTVASGPEAGPEFLRPERQNYADFICACDRWAGCSGSTDDPADGDVNMDVEIDRAQLDGQPGFWTDGWLNDPRHVRSKLDDDSAGTSDHPNHPGVNGTSFTNVLHCETIIYGRDADDSNCQGVGAQTLLPGWCEDGGNRVTFDGRPVIVTPLDPLPGDGGPPVRVTLGADRPVGRPDRVRVTGFLALDCHGGDCSEDDAQFHNQEIHPVYAIERLQNFGLPRAGANLSGVWHASDVGTYYLRQVGGEVWWLGLSQDQGTTFANVFNGVLQDDAILGDAVDVPIFPAAAANVAALELSCQGRGPLGTELSSTGQAWQGYRWQKLYDTRT
jgi:hypothetical protein